MAVAQTYYSLPSDALAPSIAWILETGSLTDAGVWPLSNLYDGVPHTVTKFTPSFGVTIIDGDLGVDTNVRLVSVVAHSLPAGATIAVYLSNDSKQTGEPIRASMTITARDDGLSINPVGVLTTSGRYIRILITTGAQFSIGELRVEGIPGGAGAARTFTKATGTSAFQQDAHWVDTTLKTQNISPAGVVVNYLSGVVQREFVIPTWKLDATNKALLETLIRSCRVTPTFLWVPDYVGDSPFIADAALVYFAQEPVIESLGGPLLWVTSAVLREVSAGVPVS